MKRFYFLFVVLVISLMAYADNNNLPNPYPQFGKARIEGTITKEVANVDSIALILRIPYQFTARLETYHAVSANKGRFCFEIPMECSSAIGNLLVNNNSIPFLITSGQVTRIQISLDKEDRIAGIKCNAELIFNPTDMKRSEFVMQNIMGFTPEVDPTKYLLVSPDEFVRSELVDNINRRLQFATNDSLLSGNAKAFLSDYFTLFLLQEEPMHYYDVMKHFNSIVNRDKPVSNYEPPRITPDYYKFLRQFNLNSPRYLYSYGYYGLLQVILKDKVLNLSAIGEIAIDTWQKQVKAVMAPLVGFDSGLFYDLLTTSAYSLQFEKLSPLTAKQKQNIEAYYKNGEIAKILLSRNETIKKMVDERPALVINKTPDVPKEKLLDAIVSKYKGKVVYVDLWATWCGPCLQAIQESRGIKAEMKGENVVFVYLTNETSPEPLWNEKMQGIGGEHYRLNEQQWEYLMTQCGFEGIPSYLFYTKNGTLVKKYTAYPGNQEVLHTLNILLRQ